MFHKSKVKNRHGKYPVRTESTPESKKHSIEFEEQYNDHENLIDINFSFSPPESIPELSKNEEETLEKQISKIEKQIEFEKAKYSTQSSSLDEEYRIKLELIKKFEEPNPLREDPNLIIEKEQNQQELYDLRNEVINLRERDRQMKTQLEMCRKEVDDYRYILQILPNDNSELLDLAKKRIYKRCTADLSEQKLKSDQIYSQYEQLKDQEELLRALSIDLKHENDTLLQKIDSLIPLIEEIKNAREEKLIRQNENRDCVPKSVMDEQIIQIHKNLRDDLQVIKKQYKNRLREIRNDYIKSQYELEQSKLQSQELQKSVEQINAQIEQHKDAFEREKARLKKKHELCMNDIRKRHSKQKGKMLDEQNETLRQGYL